MGTTGSHYVVAQKPKKKPKELKMMECIVCCNTLPKASFSVPSKPNCKHEACICSECLIKDMSSRLQLKGPTSAVQCPHPGCTVDLKPDEVQEITKASESGRKAYTLYCDGLFQKYIWDQPDFIWCSNYLCGSGQLHYGENDEQVLICHACKKLTCAFHKTEYHDGMSCSDYDKKIAKASQYDGGEALNKEFVGTHAKNCPKCTVPIIKDSGCDHMTCTRCNWQFCWRCLAKWQDGMNYKKRHLHKKTCVNFKEEAK